jgi:predicted phosphodiesterase
MHVLLISDVHANLEALEAVLADCDRWDEVWNLGDTVGYGPDPNACVQRLAELGPEYWLAGNHDWAALGRLDLQQFNSEARIAAVWTAQRLSPDNVELLSGLAPRVDLPDMTLVHGSPRGPIWEYIVDTDTAAANFEHFDTPHALFGHTHVPIAYDESIDGAGVRQLQPGSALRLGRGRRMINPGSVGQPRDGDPRASYMVLDLEAKNMTLHRVEYDIAQTQAKMRREALPGRLVERLAYGW